MASPKLPNYLLRHRKRLGLSQREIALLLGVKCGAKACRHERFVRTPSLEKALAYEAIFKIPVRELFSGLFEKIEAEVAARAKILASKSNSRDGPDEQTVRKRRTLAKLAVTRLTNIPKSS